MIVHCQPENFNADNLSISRAHTPPQIVNCSREGNYGSSQRSAVFGPVLLARLSLYGVLSNLWTGAQCGLSSMSPGLAFTLTHAHTNKQNYLNTLLSDAEPLENVIGCFLMQWLPEDTDVKHQ